LDDDKLVKAHNMGRMERIEKTKELVREKLKEIGDDG